MGRKGIFLFLGLLPILLSSCTPKPQPKNQVEVVTGICITCQQGSETQTRSFTQPDTLEKILTYLRQQQPVGQPELDPERLLGPRYTIQVDMSGGGRHIYYQYADAYFSKDYHPWQTIGEARTTILENLLVSGENLQPQ